MSALEREIADLINTYLDNEDTSEDLAHDILKLIRSKDVSEIVGG